MSKELDVMAWAINCMAAEANIPAMPTVTLTFETREDLFRFQATLKMRTEPYGSARIEPTFGSEITATEPGLMATVRNLKVYGVTTERRVPR